MNILHVTIANPELSQGGLSRYCNEIMETEKSLGHNVYALFPGKLQKNGKIKIVTISQEYFMVNNALPVAMASGTKNPKRYMEKVDIDTYIKWLRKQKFDVVHVHSIQGIHKEFFEAAHELEIPMIYTTHDYYPICMKCNLVNSDNKICEKIDVDNCFQCNANGGLNYNTQKIRQSGLYMDLKKKKWFKLFLSLITKSGILKSFSKSEIAKGEKSDFGEYINYRKDILEMFDCIHCNSFLTMEVYKKFLPDVNYQVIPITHAGLERFVRNIKIKNVYNVGYMGGMYGIKGYYIFEEALNNLESKAIVNWKAWFYGGSFGDKTVTERRYYCKYFTSIEEKEIWDKLDILVVPSQWYETFGFVVLEALCHGIPVICSDLVGSKYLLKSLDGKLIFKYDNVEELGNSLEYLLTNQETYNQICEKIGALDLDVDMEKHTEKILELYNSYKL